MSSAIRTVNAWNIRPRPKVSHHRSLHLRRNRGAVRLLSAHSLLGRADIPAQTASAAGRRAVPGAIVRADVRADWRRGRAVRMGLCGAHFRSGAVARGAQAAYVLHRRGGALLRVLPVRNGAGGLHDTGLDAAYGQGDVPATGGS